MERKNKNKYLFISVKPEFAAKLLSKEKSIELRKIKPNVREGDYIVIYASSPVKCVVGFGKIKQIIITTPKDMWLNNRSILGIDESRYEEYYRGREYAVGIEIEMIKSVPAIPLAQIKMIDPNFHPPQVYRYVTNDQICRIITEFIVK